ncbi:TOBE domain-containing protein [Flaviflexus huanghaiensis]|uniref:TOBE domain-containing protein n=1 Tax=Flaviflexus huanghaiensis TaxID=1111473 RepID=UPI0015FA09BB|nr:TOBE domain-containing protein [Flaviflexus huanghaiensis]
MSIYKVRDVARLLGVSDDTVRRWIDEGSLESRRDGSRILVEGSSVAELAIRLAEGKSDHDDAVSTRNEFSGIVTRIQKDGVMAQVDLQCGIYRVVSLISAEAVVEMGLEVGSPATALVKATSVSIRSEMSE